MTTGATDTAQPAEASSLRACPLCAQDDPAVLGSITAQQVAISSPFYGEAALARLGVPASESYPIVQCRRCELVFTGQVPSDVFLGLVYGTAEGADVEANVAVFARPDRLAHQLRSVAQLIEALGEARTRSAKGVPDQALRILDYGCSFGAGLLALHRPGFPFEVTAVEIDGGARSYLAAQGVPAVAHLDELDSQARFDGFLLNDVLEHVPDPLALLRDLAARAAPGALLYINVPDFAPWRLEMVMDQVRGGGAVAKDLNPWEHLTYFAPGTLTAMAQSGGWRRREAARALYPLLRSGGRLGGLKDIARLVRDGRRFRRGTWPDQYATSGLFTLA